MGVLLLVTLFTADGTAINYQVPFTSRVRCEAALLGLEATALRFRAELRQDIESAQTVILAVPPHYPRVLGVCVEQ